MVCCQTAILLGFLVQTVTICSSSSSDKASGDSNAIFIRYERLASPSRFLRRDFTIFIWEKERSTEAVSTGMVRQTLARMLKFGNMVSIMELVDNSFNCSLISFLGWSVIYRWKVFHSVSRSELEVMTAGIRNSSPTTVSAGRSDPWCSRSTLTWSSPYVQFSKEFGVFLGSKMLKQETTSCETKRFAIFSFN